MNLRFFRPLVAGLLALAATGATARADENLWPLRVTRAGPEAAANSWQAVGPLVFRHSRPDGGTASGLRPLWLEQRGPAGDLESWHFVYPLLSYRERNQGHSWSLLNLIVRDVSTGTSRGPAARGTDKFEIWPLYFSRQTGSPATSYRAVFPLYGRLTSKFGFDRFDWALFPLFGRFEKNGVTTTTAPWPFIKVMRGDGNRGLEIWPLAGQRAKPGVYREQFLLWPLLQRRDAHLDNPARTTHQAHFLPFYAVDRQPGYVSETFGWPFWGYVNRTLPYRYHARHYLWPFWVQGRGDDRHVNRWAPFYTHSVIKGYDKTWVMWPFWREARWQADGLDQTRRQFLYFLYHETEQRSPTNSALAAARKTHVWPLWSSWNNGAGRRQVQALSPFEVFLPHNEIVRHMWSPLFALYRFNQTQPGDVRHSLLWDGITYERRASRSSHEFHLGPLLSVTANATTQKVSLLGGLLGMKRAPGERTWRLVLGASSSPAPASSSSP